MCSECARETKRRPSSELPLTKKSQPSEFWSRIFRNAWAPYRAAATLPSQCMVGRLSGTAFCRLEIGFSLHVEQRIRKSPRPRWTNLADCSGPRPSRSMPVRTCRRIGRIVRVELTAGDTGGLVCPLPLMPASLLISRRGTI